MSEKKKALDVDGVLANFYLAMCRRFNKPYVSIDKWGEPWLEERLPDVLDDYDFWDNLPNMNRPDAINFDFDYYITAIPIQFKDSRIKWLKKNGYPDKPVIVAFNKDEAMIRHGVDILIDDKYENIEKVTKAGLIGIHYVPDYLNPSQHQHHHPELTIKHLSEVNTVIDGFKDLPHNFFSVAKPT